MSNAHHLNNEQLAQLARQIKTRAIDLGFQYAGICDIDLGQHETHLFNWLNDRFHGEMDYMERHGTKRSRPADLVPGTVRVISVRMDYWPGESIDVWSLLEQPERAYISRYALGRDYHKVLRNKLQNLADYIQELIGPFGFRAFVDSAPVLEKAIAEKGGSGWIGKHSNLLSREAGSWFFLGELYVDIPLPTDAPVTPHCGTCNACIDICPTQAIVAPYRVDARRCISYLTIELKGPIPIEFRKAIGNRIYGCDDCQLVCPWNRFAQPSREEDFQPRHHLDDVSLIELFEWTENDFLKYTEGSPIRRIGYERWQRNIAIALGNAPTSERVIRALKTRLEICSPLVREHIEWALRQHSSE